MTQKTFPLTDLYWDKHCGMSVFGTEEALEKYLDGLEEDMKINGIKVPPNIRKLEDKEKPSWKGKEYLVLQGNHRCEVARRLGMTEIRCKVVS